MAQVEASTPMVLGVPSVALPTAGYQPGSYTSVLFGLPDQANLLTISASRALWSSTGPNPMLFDAEISFDGGLTWQLAVGFKTIGGSFVKPDNTAATASSATVTVKPGVARLIRAKLTTQLAIGTQVTLIAQAS